MMHVFKSKVLEKLRNGEIVISGKSNLLDPRVVEIAGMCGYDCLWLDLEHVPNDWCNLENQIRAAKLHGMDTVVRVSKGCYSDLVRPLEADATGIMIPHLMDLNEAQNIVQQTRFQPVGRRPLDGGNIDGAFCMVDLKAYLKESNEQKFIIVQIEDPEPLKDLDDICQVDGIDIVLFGPGDFSHSIGVPGEFDHPAIADARKQVAATAVKHGKVAGTVGTLGNLGELVEMGYRFINIGADVIGLADYYKNITTSAQQIIRDITTVK
jgi:4-hydroxy-2-oxoheptanedioate aldolase